MKTALVTTSYLDGADASGDLRILRNMRYLEFYLNIQDELGFEQIIFFDNNSSFGNVNTVKNYADEKLRIIRFTKHLVGGRFAQDYPYCWRALYHWPQLFEWGFEKLIVIDSDFFVLSKKAASWIRETNTGWSAAWCPRYQFPEASMQIFCKDARPILEDFMKTPFEERNGKLMEQELPFTHINTELISDRFGEIDAKQEPFMDMYGQAKLSQPLTFEGK